jgi:hypothetical protein
MYGEPYAEREAGRRAFIKQHGWSLPFRNGKAVNGIEPIACWKYFPVPYWGDPKNDKLKAIILNTNQHTGYDAQNIILGCYQEPYITYRTNSYYDTVKKLSDDNRYATTKTYLMNNVPTISGIYNAANEHVGIKSGDILQLFLTPWFTREGNSIKAQYLERNANIILDRILKPAAKLSKSLPEPLKSVVLVRSNALHKAKLPDTTTFSFNDKNDQEGRLLEKLRIKQPELEVSYFQIDGAVFINFYFHGGESLPADTIAITEIIAYIKSK